MEHFQKSRVAVFGIGGVGGYAVEALARSGIGTLDLIDDDKVCITNLNRQLFALRSTVGKYKVDAAAERIQDICPSTVVHRHKCFYLPETADQFDFRQYDYVIDAIDTVTGKLEIIQQAKNAGVPVISAMGAGNKLDPTAFRVADIYETKMCPLARVMRNALRTQCVCPPGTVRKCTVRRDIPGSTAFVPSVVGLIVAGEVLNDLAAQVEE